MISSRHAALVLGTIAAALWGCAPSAAGEAKASTPTASAAPSPAAATSGSVRLTLRLSPGGAEILSRAASDASVQRRDPYRNEPTFFRVLDGAGRVLAERGFKLETELRGEVPDADGALTGTHTPLAAPVVSIQVPSFAETAVIRLYRRDAAAPNAEPVLLAEVRP
jgi:hypothetical protein